MLQDAMPSWPLALLALRAMVAAAPLPDPSPAPCESEMNKIKDLLQVSCLDQGLARVPGGLPTETGILKLSGNRLAHLSLASFQPLSLLSELDLTNNSLSALETGATLPRLQQLLLSHNALERLPAFQGLPALWRLALDHNALAGLPAGAFRGLDLLRDLELQGNRLRTLPPGAFAGLRSLRDLDLADNRLEALPAALLAGLPELEILRLERNRLERLPGGFFPEETLFAYLYLAGNPWHCDCRLRYLRGWLAENELSIYTRMPGPGKTITENNPESVQCHQPPELQGRPVLSFQATGCEEEEEETAEEGGEEEGPEASPDPGGPPKTTPSGPTAAPTTVPLTSAPTTVPLTSAPTSPLTSAPTEIPLTSAPTEIPLTSAPTSPPMTSAPTMMLLTPAPTSSPLTSAPTTTPLTSAPTSPPMTSAPTTMLLTTAPTSSPLTSAPAKIPLTSAPTTTPLTSAPTTLLTSAPPSSPLTSALTSPPVTSSPATLPLTSAPSSPPLTSTPTVAPTSLFWTPDPASLPPQVSSCLCPALPRGSARRLGRVGARGLGAWLVRHCCPLRLVLYAACLALLLLPCLAALGCLLCLHRGPVEEPPTWTPLLEEGSQPWSSGAARGPVGALRYRVCRTFRVGPCRHTSWLLVSLAGRAKAGAGGPRGRRRPSWHSLDRGRDATGMVPVRYHTASL